MGRRKGRRRRGREYYYQTRRNIRALDPQRIVPQIPSLEQLLGIEHFKDTIRKGLRDSARQFKRRLDPLDQRYLHDRSLRRQKKRRDELLRKVATAERIARSKPDQRLRENRYTPEQIHRICNDRAKRRESLFAKKMIGKGRGSGKTRKYDDKSKIKC